MLDKKVIDVDQYLQKNRINHSELTSQTEESKRPDEHLSKEPFQEPYNWLIPKPNRISRGRQ
jgi:hypothetical protein